jgi:hypothetical protein
MKREYILGEDSNQITLEVTIGTTAIASTVVARHRSGGEKTVIARSDVDSGNIGNTAIGSAAALRDSVLVIVTVLNITDPTHIDSMLHGLVTRYKIAGGFSGMQTYDHDTDDITINASNTIVVVSKAIKFTSQSV